MSDILTKATVLVLNRNWQAINPASAGPQEAFCMMEFVSGLVLRPVVRSSALPAIKNNNQQWRPYGKYRTL